jgi:uncharacterized membrane protein YbaN (DUF454 family)
MPIKSLFTNLKRLVFISLGLIFLALGIIGYVLPGLPGTIWLIISATFFVRSSDRLYNFVLQNRFFGRQIKGFLETGQMPLRAKILALFFMWVFTISSLLFAPYGLMFDVPVFLLALTGTIYILSRPTLRSPQ